jgi:hypothetical protein
MAAVPWRYTWTSPKSAALIVCPATGELVPTGIPVSALGELPAVNVLVGCDDCGQDHEWFPDEVAITATSDP